MSVMALLALSSVAYSQNLTYTPVAVAAAISPSPGVWQPWTSAAAFGSLTYTPPSVGLYCQASNGAPWTPCVPGGGGGSGTVTNTAGSLTALYLVIGNSGNDEKVDLGCSTDGAGNLTCGSLASSGTSPDSWTALADPGSPTNGQDWYSSTTPYRRKFRANATTQTYAWLSDAIDTFGAPTDNTTNNVSTSAHGLAPKLPNDATKYLDGTGNYSVPAGGGGSTKTNYLYFPTVGVSGASTSVGPNWSLPSVNAATALHTASSANQGALSFGSGSPANANAFINWQIPDNWNSTGIDLQLSGYANYTTAGNFTFAVSTYCLSSTTDLTNASMPFNAAQTLSVPVNTGTSKGLISATLTAITTTGCSAGQVMYIQINRNDSVASAVQLIAAKIKVVTTL